MRTPLETLIEWIDTPNSHNFLTAKEDIKSKAKELLEVEREVIINVHDDGFINGSQNPQDYTETISEQYFDEQFKNSPND